jgi:AcrR family transcriptional regulator
VTTRTRIDVDERRAQIVEGTRRVALERGLANVRVADVADVLDISTGLVHYHFSSKDELLVAMLRAAADADIARMEELVEAGGDPVALLDRVLREYLPSGGRDESWILWIDSWDEALRTPALATITEALDRAWVEVIEQVIAEGVRRGRFECDDPAAAAWRLSALLDGLAIQVVLPRRTMSRATMFDHARRGAAREVGLPRAAFPEA